MQEELLVTYQEAQVIFLRVRQGKIFQAQAEPKDGGLLGNIYVGKVRNVVKNINAAFVEFQKGQMGYLSLATPCIPLRVAGSRQGDNRILIGDEILVQVQKEAVKTKPPSLSGSLELPGRYVVLTTKPDAGISISRKIHGKQDRERIKQWLLPYVSNGIGLIARTNCIQGSQRQIEEEVRGLLTLYETLVQRGKHRVVFSLVHRESKGYLSQIRDSKEVSVAKILTDYEDLFEEIQQYQEQHHMDIPVELWNPDKGKMDAVYNISRTLQKALQPKVWLRNGGYLIIQPTEALVSIDVNTGKAISKKKNVEETFFKVNVEAAKEIAKQIRLRNLSGIILIDFIDMGQEEKQEELLDLLRKEVAADPIQTTVVDMTALGLVEMTRKKVRKPLYEQLKMQMDFQKDLEENPAET